jgi:quercetin dioxygenase-like cupin family protein
MLLVIPLTLAIGAGLGYALARDQAGKDAHSTDNQLKRMEILSQVLPKGDFRKVSAVTIDFQPGAAAPKHRHDVAVFGYVLQGAVENQFEGQAMKTYKTGEIWYEPPGTVHVVARNASKTEPARLLVFYVQEEGKALSTMVK